MRVYAKVTDAVFQSWTRMDKTQHIRAQTHISVTPTSNKASDAFTEAPTTQIPGNRSISNDRIPLPPPTEIPRNGPKLFAGQEQIDRDIYYSGDNIRFL